MPSDSLDILKVAETLNRHGVDYVIVGGIAVVLHGGRVQTTDVDLAFPQDADNVARLADALEELHAMPARWNTPNYRLTLTDFATSWLHLKSDAGDIDLILKPPGTTIDQLLANKIDLAAGASVLPTAALADLIGMKKAAGRARDHAHLQELLLICELQKED